MSMRVDEGFESEKVREMVMVSRGLAGQPSL